MHADMSASLPILAKNEKLLRGSVLSVQQVLFIYFLVQTTVQPKKILTSDGNAGFTMVPLKSLYVQL